MIEAISDRTDSVVVKKEFSELAPEAISDELMHQIFSEAEQFSELPMQIIEKYVELAAQRHGILKRLPDGNWFATIPGFEGVWASEPTRERTLEVLEEVVFDWTLLKIHHKDKDLPVLEEIDLNVL